MDHDQLRDRTIENESAVGDAVYRALADTDRRLALYVVLEVGQCSLDELADAVTGWAAARSSRVAERSTWERVHVRLVHVDVPMLDRAGLIAYDRRRGVAAAAVDDDHVGELIRWAFDQDVQGTRPITAG